MMNDIIEATILNVKFKGEKVLLPRIPMILTDMSFEFKHLQYPVRLAFAMTINKAQGLYLENPCLTSRFIRVHTRRKNKKKCVF
jgi:hypothetical protein